VGGTLVPMKELEMSQVLEKMSHVIELLRKQAETAARHGQEQARGAEQEPPNHAERCRAEEGTARDSNA